MHRARPTSRRLLSITSNISKQDPQYAFQNSLPALRGFSSKRDATRNSETASQPNVWEELKQSKHQEYWSKANKPYRLVYLILAAVIINISVKHFRKKASEPVAHAVFNKPKFTSFTIVARETVSPTSFILTLRPDEFIKHPPRNKSDPYEKEWEQGIWSVEFKQPQLQIARSYTPLPPDEKSKPGDLRFLIRKEKGGEVSNYLAALPARGSVELRGPHTGVELPKHVTEVMFLAGGTGIAPALQVVYTLLDKRRENQKAPRIHIVWANRRREDCVGGSHSAQSTSLLAARVVRELQDLQQRYPENLKVDYLVDEEGTMMDQKTLVALTKNKSEVKSTALTSRVDSRLLFISGPEGFVNFLAGPKIWDNGKETQGEIGGLLGRLGLRDWKAWKL